MIEDFDPVEFEDTLTGHPELLETYGRDLDRVNDASDHNVWTVLEGDNGRLYVSAGFHYVNRIGYIITRIPWQTGVEEFLWE